MRLELSDVVTVCLSFVLNVSLYEVLVNSSSLILLPIGDLIVFAFSMVLMMLLFA